MHRILPYPIVLFLIFSVLGDAVAQGDDPSSIGEAWLSAVFEYRPTKRLDLNWEQQIRFKTFGRAYERSFTELGVQYELVKDFKLGVGYRYINEYDDQGGIQGREVHHRFHYNADYEFDIKRLEVGLRAQYQHKSEENFDNLTNFDVRDRRWWRLKTDLEYDFRNWKMDPKFGVELFYRDETEQVEQASRYRAFIGATYKLKGPHELTIKYMHENGLSEALDIPFNILKLEYKYVLKRKKKKEEGE